ncbi:MAG: inositol monophosphatase [Candidatus Doudnabacteria bacterium]|nr:inositol monophosphatase [Candidatus Doudnabacteria bacterium]
MDKLLKTAIEAADAASKILLEGFIKGTTATDKKTSDTGDWITEYDYKAQNVILKIISKNFPTHSLLSEEGVDEKRNSPYRWIIDPLDGTTNFSRGVPIFATSIGLEKDGKLFLGAVGLPAQKQIYYAQKDKGAFLNKKKISVSSVSEVSKSTVGISMARTKEALKAGGDIFTKVILAPAKPRVYGSIAADLARVASGQLDASVVNFLNPWDMAAGFLLIQEAGGSISRLDGKNFSWQGKQFLASNKLLHPKLKKLLA